MTTESRFREFSASHVAWSCPTCLQQGFDKWLFAPADQMIKEQRCPICSKTSRRPESQAANTSKSFERKIEHNTEQLLPRRYWATLTSSRFAVCLLVIGALAFFLNGVYVTQFLDAASAFLAWAAKGFRFLLSLA